jgi:hypothetical protein
MWLLGCLAVSSAGPRCADLEGEDDLPVPLRNDTLDGEAAIQGAVWNEAWAPVQCNQRSSVTLP